MIKGFPVLAAYLISGVSTISNDAILYAGAFNDSSKSTAVLSNGELKIEIPIYLAKSKRGLCQSHGICASSYKS